MIFVGRKEEIGTVLKALERGENIVITGKFGIGRTSLIRYISYTEQNRRRFIFTDFSKTAKSICSAILTELYPAQADAKDLSFGALKHKLANFNATGFRKLVLVMDNIAKLTSQKLMLIRHLSMQKQFRFIAITEQFLEKSELDRLRGRLLPVISIKLSYLTKNESIELARRFYQLCKMDISRIDMDSFVTPFHGYPLAIQQHFQSKLLL